MQPFSIRRSIVFPLVCLALAVALPLPASAQSLAVEGLQFMLDDVRNDRERREVIDVGAELHQELTNEVDALQRARDNSSGYLLYDADGRLINVGNEDVVDLAETFATDLVLSDNHPRLIMGHLLRGESGSDLDYAIARAAFSIIKTRPIGENGDEHIVDYVLEALTLLLDEADARNRQALDQEITQVFADRAAVAGMVQAARAMWGDIVPAAPPAPEGFMNEAGFWLVQLSGSGWHKLGAGYATRIIGFQNIVIQITDEVTEPNKTTWYWQLPVGYDLQVFQRARQEEARDSSRDYCANRVQLGPRDPAPQIWNDGPNYELVQGPVASWQEARLLLGDSSRPNNDTRGSKFWDLQKDLRYKDLDPTCESYGVSLVD